MTITNEWLALRKKVLEGPEIRPFMPLAHYREGFQFCKLDEEENWGTEHSERHQF